MAQQQVNQTERISPSGSVTSPSSPGQGGGQEQTAQDDSLFSATGIRRTNQLISDSNPENIGNSLISQNRNGQGSKGNFQGFEDMGIYMAIPSLESRGKYVEFDNLGIDAAHELIAMYRKVHSSNSMEFEDDPKKQDDINFNKGNTFTGETDKTIQFGHSGISGKSLAPDSEDGRKTSPIRGGKGEGINQQANK